MVSASDNVSSLKVQKSCFQCVVLCCVVLCVCVCVCNILVNLKEYIPSPTPNSFIH
jgi:hypothetical protein